MSDDDNSALTLILVFILGFYFLRCCLTYVNMLIIMI